MKVKIFPASTVPVTKCNHRFGAEMTFSHQTDSRFTTSIFAAELYGFKNNIRLGAFVNNILGQNNDSIGYVEATGLMRHDIYFGTDAWFNPVTQTIETTPDHYGTEWTALGQAAFGKTPGTAKPSRTPAAGKQMYDVSNGQYGFDTVTGQYGTSNLIEYLKVVEKQNELILEKCNRNASAGSYRNGVQGSADVSYTSFLGVRNSSYGNVLANLDADTWYGAEGLGNKLRPDNLREFYRTYPSSSRWWDFWNNIGATKPQATQYVQEQIALCLSQNGWWRDFCHWHSCYNNGTLPTIDEFLSNIRLWTNGNFIHTCSNGEALEYMYARELCEDLIAFEKNNTVVIIANISDKFKGQTVLGFPIDTPVQQMNTPLSIEIDLSNTYLAGKNVKSSFSKLRNLGNNKYIAEIPINAKEGLSSVVLEEGAAGIFNEAIPVISTSISGTTLTASSNMPVKAVLYSVNTGLGEEFSMPYFRINDFKMQHIFPGLEASKDYRLGVISEFGQTTLIEI